ncbi:ATP-binding cassette domain-containing protein [Conexibacter sp. S30A1]|uniref:ATP-binding cassette domain-containing protein n=1 Tax=Conexibacter sp. S30A1 TaxID=2937800 RepID=UPI0020109511|nr:ATP-binding cassette domain-containing protein [Conexibacter sp. S30A1]
MLEVTGLAVGFGEEQTLERVDLRVNAGEIVALAGEPGAGKTALVRCLSGDLQPSSGTIRVDGRVLSTGLRAAEHHGIAVVWQDLALCETLDVAGNLLLGLESSAQTLSTNRFYARAAGILADLGLTSLAVAAPASSLSGSQRGLLALAMALARAPRILLLDEPTAAMGASETAELEQLLARKRDEGLAVLLATRDIDQMFRLADRIVVLRQGRTQDELDPQDSHPDDVAALLAGGSVDGSARRQLIRLHGLADSLAVADPSSGLALIVSALAAALNLERSSISVVRADTAQTPAERVIVDGPNWLVPVTGPAGTSALITIRREQHAPPSRDELDLLGLYAGYTAAALERQEAEAAQLEAEALRRSRELQRQFLSRLSHELRTPLTAIRGYASSLLAPDIVWDEESQQRFLETIASESARLGRLVEDLLDFSAIDSGVMRMQLDWCQPELVIDAAIACLPDAWRERVVVGQQAGLPPIWADHDRLEQVFVNLLSNALRHNDDNARVTVTSAQRSDGSIELLVSDNGAGLPPELRRSPFDSTRRQRSATAGAGLGLSITRGIVAAHGGHIELLDTNVGATFRIVLPLEAPLPADSASRPVEEDEMASASA